MTELDAEIASWLAIAMKQPDLIVPSMVAPEIDFDSIPVRMFPN